MTFLAARGRAAFSDPTAAIFAFKIVTSDRRRVRRTRAVDEKRRGAPASFLALAEFYPLPFPRLRRRVEFAGNGNAEAAGNNKAISGMEKKLPAY